MKSTLLALIFLGLMSWLTLFSAAGGSWEPWATKQFLCFSIGLGLVWALSRLDPMRFYDMAYTTYAISFLLVVATALIGHVGMGGRRWIDLYFFHIQPSELMRTALILTLARYFADQKHRIETHHVLWPALVLVGVPLILIVKQPDLGTGILILGTSVMIAFAAGIPWRIFLGALATFCLSAPVLWHLLYDYQKKRILTFLYPELDTRAAGYHILQSKIAVGSGGLWGKGFLQGTQSHLSFLPEKHTDFIFTTFFEEWGFVASSLLILLYLYMIFYGYHIALHTRNRFEQLLAVGIASSLFMYVFVNISMVLGLLPVVGIPLPFFSYGRTSLISLMISHGLLLSLVAQKRRTRKFS